MKLLSSTKTSLLNGIHASLTSGFVLNLIYTKNKDRHRKFEVFVAYATPINPKPSLLTKISHKRVCRGSNRI